MVARQKIHAGMIHAGKTAAVICENTCFRVVIDGETAAVVPRPLRCRRAIADTPGQRAGVADVVLAAASGNYPASRWTHECRRDGSHSDLPEPRCAGDVRSGEVARA
jgi:hypothetical protein